MLLGGAAAEMEPSALILFVLFFFPADGTTGTFHQPDQQQRKREIIEDHTTTMNLNLFVFFLCLCAYSLCTGIQSPALEVKYTPDSAAIFDRSLDRIVSCATDHIKAKEALSAVQVDGARFRTSQNCTDMVDTLARHLGQLVNSTASQITQAKRYHSAIIGYGTAQGYVDSFVQGVWAMMNAGYYEFAGWRIETKRAEVAAEAEQINHLCIDRGSLTQKISGGKVQDTIE